MTTASATTFSYKVLKTWFSNWKLVVGQVRGNATYPTGGGWIFRPADIGLTQIYVCVGSKTSKWDLMWNRVSGALGRIGLFNASAEAADNDATVTSAMTFTFFAIGW